MAKTQGNMSRIAKNSLFLYVRMFITMAVSLYTSRVVLNALGVEDFGVNNAVAGFVSMFALISASLSSSISRFLTFELGHGDKESLAKVFSTSVTIQFFLVAVIIFIAETLGLWFLNTRMSIPDGRMVAANWVFQFSVISFSVNLISVPYNAAIIAHENMSPFAYISIYEALMKLVIAFVITVSPWDRLIVYSFMLMLVSLSVRIIYGIYCKRHYEEAHYHFVFDKKIVREMAGFAGWNYLGAGASILCTHGLNLLMNIFFGAAVNAARGIASQVENAVTQFVGNFTMALNPQIVKSYAVGNRDYMNRLVCLGAKYAFFLMLLLAVPIFIDAPYILKLWLKTVPDGTVLFLRLSLIVILTDVLSMTLSTAVAASGKVKTYHIRVSVLVIMVFPLTYIAYKLGAQAYFCYLLCIVAMVAKLMVKLPLARDIVGLPVGMFIKAVLLRAVPVTLLMPVLPYSLHRSMDEGFMRLAVVCLTSVLWGAFVMIVTGMAKEERKWLLAKLLSVIKRK